MKSAEWNLTDWCNYRCTYCTSGEGRHATPEVVAEVLAFFHGVFRPEVLILCGGEPTLHPQFAEVIAFCAAHDLVVRLDTNLSLPANRLLAALAPLRIRPHINATWHHEFASLPRFAETTHALRDAGHDVDVRLIAHSTEETEVRARHAALVAAGIPPTLKVEKVRRRGDPTARKPGIGAEYPPDYLAWLADTSGVSEKVFLAETRYRSYRGQICRAGHDYVYVNELGEVFRCSAYVRLRERIGHAGQLRAPWGVAPAPCAAPICKCREAERLDLLEEPAA